MTNYQLQRAYRLSQLPWDGLVISAGKAWQITLSWLKESDWRPKLQLNWAVLSLALVGWGETNLGDWFLARGYSGFTKGLNRAHLKIRTQEWVTFYAPEAYTDGSALEMGLLMCASDELHRRDTALDKDEVT